MRKLSKINNWSRRSHLPLSKLIKRMSRQLDGRLLGSLYGICPSLLLKLWVAFLLISIHYNSGWRARKVVSLRSKILSSCQKMRLTAFRNKELRLISPKPGRFTRKILVITFLRSSPSNIDLLAWKTHHCWPSTGLPSAMNTQSTMHQVRFLPIHRWGRKARRKGQSIADQRKAQHQIWEAPLGWNKNTLKQRATTLQIQGMSIIISGTSMGTLIAISRQHVRSCTKWFTCTCCIIAFPTNILCNKAETVGIKWLTCTWFDILTSQAC